MKKSAPVIAATVSLLLATGSTACARMLPHRHGHLYERLPGIRAAKCARCAQRNNRRTHSLPCYGETSAKNTAFQNSATMDKSQSPALPPSPEALKAFTVTDLADSNPLSSWIYGLVEASNEKVFEDKIVDALKNTIPLKCGYYFAIGQFEGLWGNGGMQHVVLRDEVVQTQHLLGVAAEGYEHYKRPKTAALVRELSSKMPSWMKRIEELRRREAPEDEWRAVWAEVDSYDVIFNGLLDEEGTVYTEMLADIQQYPADYTSVSQSP